MVNINVRLFIIVDLLHSARIRQYSVESSESRQPGRFRVGLRYALSKNNGEPFKSCYKSGIRKSGNEKQDEPQGILT